MPDDSVADAEPPAAVDAPAQDLVVGCCMIDISMLYCFNEMLLLLLMAGAPAQFLGVVGGSLGCCDD